MTKNKPEQMVPIALGVVGVVGLMWSWLFGIRVAALSTSTVIGYFSTLFAFVVIVAISVALFLCAIRYFAQEYRANPPTWRFLAKLFVVWAAVEFGVSVLITIIWIGRNGSVDSVLPFGSFAPLLAFTPFGFLARFVGFHGLSAAFVVLVSVVVFKKLRKYAPAVMVLLFAGTLLAWGLYRTPAGQGVDTQIIANHEGVSDPLATQSQLVIFPEYGLNGMSDGDIHTKLIENGDREIFYVGSRRWDVADGGQNVLVFGSTIQGVITERPKSRLIPGGEYLPYAAELPLRLVHADTVLEQFKLARAIEKGSEKAMPLQVTSNIKLGSGVCASIIAPKDYRGMTKDGATLLTNSASLGVFNSSLFTLQHQGLAKFMAVANARSFLQSSSDGLAFAIDHNGRMLAKISAVNSAEVTVHTNNKKTPYTYLGEWPAYIGLAVLFFGLLRVIRLRSKAKH